MGPVHALVALAGERASVTLWAERQRPRRGSTKRRRCWARRCARPSSSPPMCSSASARRRRCQAGRARALHGSRHMTDPARRRAAIRQVGGAGAASRRQGARREPAKRSSRWRASTASRSRRTRRSPRRWRRSNSATTFPRRFIARSPQVLIFILRASGKIEVAGSAASTRSRASSSVGTTWLSPRRKCVCAKPSTFAG